jgi:carbon storage regulator CsrA
MLVLSRKLHQELAFPQLGITVRVVDIRRGQVRLAIQAPTDVAVVRTEILQRKADSPDGRVAKSRR